jgi:hypothetical protein
MIEELVKVANAMENAGIVPVNWHSKLKVLPKVSKKAPCVRIWLTVDGHIHEVESLTEEQAAFLRKYEPDLGKSLPGFNVRPLFRTVKSDDEIKNAGRGKAGEKLKAEWTDDFLSHNPEQQEEDDFWNKTRDSMKRSFTAVLEELEKACADRLDENETLQRFFKAVSQIDITQFQAEYRTAIQREIENGELPSSLLCYFVTEAKKQREDSNSRTPVPKFSVFLDIVDYHEYPVAHEKTIERLNTLLMDNEKAGSGTEVKNYDAYGLDGRQSDEKFPSVKLPLLGGVILRSQAKTIAAQKRYHHCESGTFPVGQETRTRVKGALEWISDKEHDGKTYGIAGDKELLFAYPRVLPKAKVPLTKMFGAQPDEALKEDSFERLSESVIEQLRGLGHSVADSELEIFSLRKMDKARTKVVYYHNVTVSRLEVASKVWHEGCRSIPSLDIKDWSEKKDEKTGKSHPVYVEGKTVFPIKLHRLLNTVWKRDGEHSGRVRIFQPTDGLRLLLDEPCDQLANHIIKQLMQHAQGYFFTLCRCTGKREIAKLPDKVYYPSVLGLLLLKQGKRKEEYMKNSAFLLGRFLRVADEIHRLYCEVVRNNELPPELCGSSMLVSMMESPGMTLNQLALRSAPYVKWARACHDDKKGGLVHYWMQRWSEIADPLLEKGWPNRLSAEERAQVFLGYLASFPKNENQ